MGRATTGPSMLSPWLRIPLEDYERHMELPEIGQAQMLTETLASAVRERRPKSVAIAGCAGGNSVVRVAAMGVGRVVGIDFNPEYVAEVRRRLGPWVPGLELHLADIERGVPDCEPVDLVFAGLILEYVEVSPTLKVLRALCAPAGALVVVLQCPSETSSTVSESPFRSLKALESLIRLRDPASVTAQALSVGFIATASERIALPSGKAFEVLSFRA